MLNLGGRQVAFRAHAGQRIRGIGSEVRVLQDASCCREAGFAKISAVMVPLVQKQDQHGTRVESETNK